MRLILKNVVLKVAKFSSEQVHALEFHSRNPRSHGKGQNLHSLHQCWGVTPHPTAPSYVHLRTGHPGNKDLCRSSSCKDLQVSSSWIRVARHPMAGVLIGDRKERRPREDPCEDRGRGCSDVVTSRVTPRIVLTEPGKDCWKRGREWTLSQSLQNNPAP